VLTVLLVAASTSDVWAQEDQNNPVCCACGGPEPCPGITNPDVIVQLPDNPLFVSEAACSVIKEAGEDLRLIPAEVSACMQFVYPSQKKTSSLEHEEILTIISRTANQTALPRAGELP